MGVVAATCNIVSTVPTCIHTYIGEYRKRMGVHTHTEYCRGGEWIDRYIHAYVCIIWEWEEGQNPLY